MLPDARHTYSPRQRLVPFVLVALIGLALCVAVLALVKLQIKASRTKQSMNNLRRLGEAVQTYAETHHQFPPAVDGQALLGAVTMDHTQAESRRLEESMSRQRRRLRQPRLVKTDSPGEPR